MNKTTLDLQALKTPCFILNFETLEKNVKVLQDAIAMYYPNTIIGYSFKTNSLKYVCNYMKEKGFFAEVVSADEYLLAKEIGFESKKILYNGIAKNETTFKEAIEKGAIINIDSTKEIDWAIKYKAKSIGLRVNIDMEKYCPGETTTENSGGRFGFSYENGDFKRVLDKLKNHDIEVSGIHMHCSTKTRSINVYDKISQKAIEIIEKYNLRLNYVDIGGGFFGGVPGKVDFFDYFKVISKNIEKHNYLNLIIEPGASLIASCFDYLVSVSDVKQTTYNTFVITNGTRLHIDPFFRKENYDFNLQNKKAQKIKKQIICGNTCMENDRILTLIDKEKIEIEDLIKFNKVGSYTMCFSPLFITYFPNIYLYRNGMYEIIMRKWTEKEYLQGMV